MVFLIPKSLIVDLRQVFGVGTLQLNDGNYRFVRSKDCSISLFAIRFILLFSNEIVSFIRSLGIAKNFDKEVR